jgi:hypothetical protein
VKKLVVIAFSLDLTHHVMHALGSRMFGFARSCSMTRLPSTPIGLESSIRLAGGG